MGWGGGRWWQDPPSLVRVVALIALGVSLGFCLPAAMFADGGFNLGGIAGGLTGGLLSRWLTDTEYRALDESSRHTVRAVMRSGKPSGNRGLDRTALRRLAQAARQEGTNKVFAAVFAAVITACPVIAAWRMHDAYYLLTLVGAITAVPLFAAAFTNASASQRHDRLLRLLSDQSTSN